MTKEEAKKIIEYTFLNADGHLKPLDFDYGGGKGIVEALKVAMESLSQPSLPSNLDEAAEEYEHNLGYYECVNQWPSVSFKAGAKWMARKFQKIEGNLVDWYSTSDGKEYCCGIKTNEAFEVPEGFYIRKK